MNNKIVVKHLLVLTITSLAFLDHDILIAYKQIVLNSNIIILLATLIAGLFGFIVAVIPFSIQLLNQDNVEKKNKFLNKLMNKEKFDFFIKPMLNRFIKALRIMLYLFIYIFIIHILQIININKINYLNSIYFGFSVKYYSLLIVFYIYLILTLNFFIMLRSIIRDLESLVFTFIQSKNE